MTLATLAASSRDDVRRLALVAVEARTLLAALVGPVPDGGDLDALRRDVDAVFAAALDDARRELARCATTDVRRALDRRVRTLDAAATQWHVAMRALAERLRMLAESGVPL